MTFQPASLGSVLAFIGILFAVIGAFGVGVYASTRKLHGYDAAKRRIYFTMVGLTLYLLIIAVLVESGLVEATAPAGGMIFMAVSNLSAILFSCSKTGRDLSYGLSISFLVGFQSFRFPLELVLHEWSSQGTIPQTMTWTGQNWDIISGIVVIAMAPWASRYRVVAWMANALGIVLLLNVMRVAILSSPLPFSWQVVPPLQLAFHLPYALIVPVCVGGAVAGHCILTRRLLF